MPINADYWKARKARQSLLRVASGTPAEVSGIAERAVIDLEALLLPNAVLKKEVAERKDQVTPEDLASEAEQLTRAIGDLSPECGAGADQCLRGYRDRRAMGYATVACAVSLIAEVVERSLPIMAT